MESVVLITQYKKCEMKILPSSGAVLKFTTVPILHCLFPLQNIDVQVALYCTDCLEMPRTRLLSALLSHGQNIDTVPAHM